MDAIPKSNIAIPIMNPSSGRNVIKFSRLNVLAGLLLILVYDSGWVTDEVGRQPWIIYNVMTVQSAANTSSSIIPPSVSAPLVVL